MLTQLAVHGVKPFPWTRPDRVREFVNDLYCYELRRLRDRLLAGEIARPEYAGLVVDVRRRYSLLSRRPPQWLEP